MKGTNALCGNKLLGAAPIGAIALTRQACAPSSAAMAPQLDRA